MIGCKLLIATETASVARTYSFRPELLLNSGHELCRSDFERPVIHFSAQEPRSSLDALQHRPDHFGIIRWQLHSVLTLN
jgi:hypothetical protein